MANLGIVIAVSDYTADANNLPACRNDGAAIAHVLKSSGRFEEVLHLETGTTAPSVKQKLSEFTKRHAGKEIGEVFFYFTGHGEFAGDEFYYLLSDYNSKKRAQTSLENAELDGMVKSLTPKLFVKVVDACHSGVSYIKSPEDFKEYLKSANQSFQKLYFMFSSQTEQFSYQDDKISYFTESVIKSVTTHGSGTIRYKDVISFVSDDFQARANQTPLFVTQADFTEILCEVTPQLKDELKKYLHEEDQLPNEGAPPEEKRISLIDRLREDAKTYCTEEEAMIALGGIPEFAEAFSFSGELQEVFSVEVSIETTNPPQPALIGTWLNGPASDKNVFATATIDLETYRKRVAKNALLGVVATSLLGEDDYKYVDATRAVVSGFATTTSMPYNHIKIRLNPQLPNLAPEECYIVPIISRTKLRLFWAFSHFEYVDWESTQRVGKLEWATSDAPLKDKAAIRALLDQVTERFSEFVEAPLKATWGTDTTEETADGATAS